MRTRATLLAAGLCTMLVFGCFTLLTVLVALPVQLIALPWDPHRHIAAAIARRLWGSWMMAAQPLWRVHITGRERLRGGPWVVVLNHQSWVDIPLVLSLPFPMRLLTKAYVFRLPVFGPMARFGRHICIDLDDPTGPDRALAECREWLARGVSVVVFPEGNRARDGRSVQAFQRGAFELAIRTGAPLLPVVLKGAWEIQPGGRPIPEVVQPHVRIGVLPPISTAGQSRRALARAAEGAVRAAFEGPQPWELAASAAARYRPQGRWRQGWAAGKTRWDPIFWMLHERLPEGGELLDIGCGEGLLAAWLAARPNPGWRVHGLDLDPGRIAVATAANIPGATFEVADAATLGSLPAADAIVLIDVLHYLSPEAQDQLLTRLCASLRPGGLLLLRDPELRAGWRSRVTTGSERVAVATGRHHGRGVWPRGPAALAATLSGLLNSVQIEAAGAGPFANALVWGRKSGAYGGQSGQSV